MQIKSLSDILAGLIDGTTARTSQLTDFTVGSVIRSIYEAVSMELSSYYMLQEENIAWGIEHGVLDSFGFTPRDAKYAYGPVHITFYGPLAQDTYLSKGTTFFSSSSAIQQTYVLQETYKVSQGSTSADVIAYCTQVGTIGNIDAGVLDSCSGIQMSFSTITNQEAFLTGSDAEDINDVRARFNLFVDTRGRGTAKAMEYAARTIPDVAGVYIKEDAGQVTVYAHDANGDLPDSLHDAIVTVEENYRPVSIPWQVLPVVKKEMDIELQIQTSNGLSMDPNLPTAISNYIASYLNTLKAGDNLIISDIVARVRSFSPFVYDVTVNTPATNYLTAPDEIIRAGSISVIVNGG